MQMKVYLPVIGVFPTFVDFLGSGPRAQIFYIILDSSGCSKIPLLSPCYMLFPSVLYWWI